MLRQLLGHRGERLAARHLRASGFRILARRYSALGGELDLVATDDRLLLLVEVKTRRRHTDRLAASVPPQKQQRIVRAARQFVEARGLTSLAGRFDVILVDDSQRPPRIEWIQGAFEATS